MTGDTQLPVAKNKWIGVILMQSTAKSRARQNRSVMLRCIFLLVLMAAHSASSVPLENVQFDRIAVQSASGRDIGVGPLNAIVQDDLGFMWFGGELGLVRYDAHDFVFYHSDPKNPHSLSSSFIRDLLLDNEGVLWIATSGGLNRYDAQMDRFTHFMSERNNDDVRSSSDTGPEEAGGGSGALADDVTRALAVDSQNTLYIGTFNGLSILDSSRQNFKTLSEEDGLTDSYVRDVFVDDQDRVWIGTANGGLNLYEPLTGQIRHWRADDEDPRALPTDAVESIVQDHQGNIWLGTFGGGVAKLDRDMEGFTVFQHEANNPGSIGSDVIRDLYVDKDNNLWVGIDHNGLAVFDRERQRFKHFTHSAYNNTSISSNSVRSIFEDSKGDLWIGNFPTGINFVNSAKSIFRNIKHDPNDSNSLSNNGVLCLLKASNGVIWIGTEGGLSAYHPSSGRFEHYQYTPGNEDGLQSNAVVTIEEDSTGELWIGTWSGGLYRFNTITERFTAYLPDKDEPGSINSPFIWKIVRDQNDVIWVATEAGGISRYDRARDSFTAYTHNPLDPQSISFDYVWTLHNDSRDTLWIGTLNGLNRINKRNGTFKRYFHDVNNPASITSNRIISLHEDSRSRLWVGTEEGGLNLYVPETDSFEPFKNNDKLPSPNITSIVEDQRGYLWLSTSSGIASIHPDSLAVQAFTTNDGLAGNVHNRDASMVDDSGNVYFGSTEGLTVFDPEQLSYQSNPPRVVIDGFKVLNQPVAIGSEDSPLQRAIYVTDSLQLGFKDTMFSFEYAALSYRASALNQYAYMLEGFDETWNYVGSMRTATYTNIDAGTYIFRVKGANSNGLWSEQDATVKVTILPSPWKSWWAYLGYLVACICVFWAIFNIKVKRIELEKERKVNAKLLKLDKLKDTFLANTSHELRTPLNGIVGITESLMDGVYGSVSDNILEKLKTIAYSGRRLSVLINDILDYSKLKEKKVLLNPQALNLGEVVDLVFALLSPLAQNKNITLLNHVTEQMPWVEADSNRLQQILLNLVGNAIKYSHKGYVRVFADLDEEQDRIKISIEDTGIGVPKEDLDLIFDAFNQVDSADSQQQEGTGLGLAVSRQLVELHGGRLAATSKIGFGSTFSFTLPKARSKPKQEPIRVSKNLLEAEPLSARYVSFNRESLSTSAPRGREIVHDLPGPSWAKDSTVLIVDDDPVNRMVLQGMLSLHRYRVLEARDGYEALRILAEPVHAVDLVLLDIMMPGINGFQVCEKIRLDYPMHELPVVFLTAKDIEQDVKRGFDVGGNEFVGKPVSKYQLLPRIENCLQQARLFRQLREQIKRMAQSELMRDAAD